MNKAWILIISIALIATSLAAFLYYKYRVAPSIELATLQLETLDNIPVNTNSFKGEKVAVCFFATWCGACIKELPSLENAQHELRQRPTHFFLVSDEPIEVLKKFESRHNVSITILHCLIELKKLGVVTYPTAYVFDSRGQIIYSKTGETNWNSKQNLSLLW